MRYLIWSHEHDAWWRPGGWGYTTNVDEAGRYSLIDASRIVLDANLITVNEQAIPEAEASVFHAAPSFCCPRCRRRSFNPHDVAERYCGACHLFTEDQ